MKSKEELLKELQGVANKYPKGTYFDIAQAESQINFVAHTYTDSKGNSHTIWRRRVETERKK